MTIEEIEQQIVDEFEGYSDWMDRYNYLIEFGKSIQLIDDEHKVDQYLISGCQSKLWLSADYENGRVNFKADSDAIITKGIAGLLTRVMSGQTPDDIINAKLEFIDKIGLKEHLSPTRANGLLSLVKQMKLYAMVFKAKAAQNN
jgi:cysteine desulfuration protein SufE